MPVATAAQLRDLLPYLSGTGEDTLLDTLIARADAALARRLGFPAHDSGGYSLGVSTYTLVCTERHIVAPDELALHPWPVVAVTTLHADTRGVNPAYDSGSLVSLADYTLDSARGRIYLLPVRTFSTFPSSRRCVRVVFTAGWSTLPADLMQVVLMMAKHLYERRAQQGIVSAEGKAFVQGEPPEIADLIGRYSVESYL